MPKMRLFGRITSNLGYKFAALALATLVWYIVQGEEVLEVNGKLDVKVEVASGFAVRDGNVVSRDVTLRGPRALVGPMQGKQLQAIIRIPAGKSGSLRYRLDKEFIPRWDNRVRLTIHDPYVTLAIEERLIKKLPVRAMLLGEVDQQLMLEEVKANPAEIEVSGAKSDVQRLTEIGTEPIDISGLKESKSVVSGIARATLPEVELSARDVAVSLKLGPKKISKDLQVVPIEITDTDKVGAARPASVSVTVSAPQEQIERISQKDIHAIVSAKDLTPGRYELSVIVKTPEGVSIKEISPKTVSIEIYNHRKLK